jgi:proteasome lid subunit RPN8/RPN11
MLRVFLKFVNPDLWESAMSLKKVTVPKEIFAMVFESARRVHPKETIFLLRGKKTGNSMNITELIIPPAATRGKGFSGFPMHMLPIDFSIVGTVHSHPSGNLLPSVEDLNRSLGKIIVIVGFPYHGSENVAAYNRDGKKLNLHVV